MGERVEQIQKMIKSFENSQKRIARKYNGEDIKNEMKDIDNALNEINKKLKRKDLHIQRLEEQLQEVSPSERDLVEEYKNAIEKAKSEYEEEKQNSEMQKYLDKKEELSIKLKSDKTNNEKLIKQEVRNAEDKLRARLTQEGIKLDNEINRTELNMKLVLADMTDFKYQYEEKDGARIATNGDEYREINEKYESLKTELTELKDAKKLCESKLQEFKDRDAKEAEKFSNAWNEVKKSEEAKEAIDSVKKEEQKMEPLDSKDLFKELKDDEEENKQESIEEITPSTGINYLNEEQNDVVKRNDGTQLNENEEELKIVSIDINENKGTVYSKTEDGNVQEYQLKDILKEKRKLYYDEYVKECCEYVAGGRIRGMLLAAKVNPAIVKVFEGNPGMLETYVQCLKDKKELPFELTHDLRDSKLGMFQKIKMWVRARAEDKIPGTKIIFAESRWNKNETLPEAGYAKIDENDTEIVGLKENNISNEERKEERINKLGANDLKEENLQNRVKVPNNNNQIEINAQSAMEEAQQSIAKDVKDITQQNEEKTQ